MPMACQWHAQAYAREHHVGSDCENLLSMCSYCMCRPTFDIVKNDRTIFFRLIRFTKYYGVVSEVRQFVRVISTERIVMWAYFGAC